MQDLELLKSDMASKGFAVYGLVSQPQSEADAAKAEWGISYDIIGSPDVSLVKHLSDEKIINLVISEKKNYPNGMVQPALLFMRRSDRAVLFSWAVDPVSSPSDSTLDRSRP